MASAAAPSTPPKAAAAAAAAANGKAVEPDFSEDIKSPTNEALKKAHEKDQKQANGNGNGAAAGAGDARGAAEEHKKKGNELFAAHKFASACDEYTKAIECDAKEAVYWANRAFCHLKLEEYGSAVEDATNAIALNPKYVKGYYRRGAAYLGLVKYKMALADFQQAVTMCPKDKDAINKRDECQKAFRAEMFLKAIESEYTKPPSETVDVKSMVVEPSYDGPRLEGPVTVQFVQALIEHFRAQKRLHKKYVYQMLLDAVKLFRSLPTLIDVDVPAGTHITVCGDVHGQLYDLLNIFKLNGLPSEANPYLFNGDFVDRGSFSFEIIVLFIALKLLYPNHFHMTRGNHESKTMNNIYGFKGEVVAKMDAGASFELFSELFNYLPLAVCIGKKVLVVHGGLFSRDDVTLADIKKIDRNCQPPDTGLMCELMWSDPMSSNGRAPSKRGVALQFGPDVTSKFLALNGLEMIVRSHEVKDEGYEVEHGGKLVTVFSAPNYCDQMGNKGAFIRFGADLKPNYTTFTAVEHPNVPPMHYASSLMQRNM